MCNTEVHVDVYSVPCGMKYYVESNYYSVAQQDISLFTYSSTVGVLIQTKHENVQMGKSDMKVF
jgi:hypothetical protein